ncbi:DNA ligase 1-like [Prunus yedoensis var. nudiflora]|uniref:DNA ligase 1-like n=1 Tax=Prunus yedoensis var. nudiflora TaxID=2094558 RepID=A0A314XI21_PRUYE|nr:DNA ligase 1-like [Prunus yedoensis var. nudiflora]
MEQTNNKKPSALPTNYVTILELKERWLKDKERQRDEEERQRKEKEQEEEELRQQKLREEQAKQQKQNAVVLKTRTDSRPTNRSNQTQFRPVNRRSVSECKGAELEGKKQPVVQKTEAHFKPTNRSDRTQFGPVNLSVSDREGAELDGKKQPVVQKTEADFKPRNRNDWTRFGPLIGVFRSARTRFGPVNRSVSECEGAELEGKKQPVVQKTEADFQPRNRNDRTQFGPVNQTVSECEGAELEGKKSEEPGEKKVRKKKKKKKLWKNKKDVRAEKEESIVDVPQSSCEKGDDQAMVPTAEIVPKFRDLSVNGETGKGDDELKRPRIVDRRGNGGIRGYYVRPDRFDMQKQRGYAGRVWVKKGEVADDSGGGVQQRLERNDVIYGQTGTSSNASSLKFTGGMSRNNPRRWWLSKHEPKCL